jgi:hypothetical protein
MQFVSKNTVSTKTSTSLNTDGIAEVHHFKFLGPKIDDVLSWNIHIDSVINKLTIVCFMLRSIRPYMTQFSFVNIYYSLLHSVLSYGIVFWGQATNTKELFILQKRVVHLMTGYGYRHSCWNLLKQLGILPLKSQYIYSVLLFISKNWKLFTTNHYAHNLQTRHRNDLYLPTSTLTLYQKGVYYTGMKLFNNLPQNIQEIVGSPKQFKIALRRYLVTHCFYDLRNIIKLISEGYVGFTFTVFMDNIFESYLFTCATVTVLMILQTVFHISDFILIIILCF